MPVQLPVVLVGAANHAHLRRHQQPRKMNVRPMRTVPVLFEPTHVFAGIKTRSKSSDGRRLAANHGTSKSRLSSRSKIIRRSKRTG